MTIVFISSSSTLSSSSSSQVLEALPDHTDACLNLAHIYNEQVQSQYSSSFSLVQHVLFSMKKWFVLIASICVIITKSYKMQQLFFCEFLTFLFSRIMIPTELCSIAIISCMIVILLGQIQCMMCLFHRILPRAALHYMRNASARSLQGPGNNPAVYRCFSLLFCWWLMHFEIELWSFLLLIIIIIIIMIIVVISLHFSLPYSFCVRSCPASTWNFTSSLRNNSFFGRFTELQQYLARAYYKTQKFQLALKTLQKVWKHCVVSL